MPEEKKNLFDKAIDALTDRDEKEAEAKAKAEAEAAKKKGAEIRAKMEAEAKESAAERASATKAAADKAIAAKAAADKAAVDRAASMKAAAAAPKKGVVNVRSLHIRKEHSTTSAEVGGLTHGEEVTILETWSDGKNTWAKLGPDQWAAIVYNGDTLIKLS